MGGERCSIGTISASLVAVLLMGLASLPVTAEEADLAARSADLVSVDGRLAIGEPIYHESLTLFPIVDNQAPERPGRDLLTLEEGLRAGTVTAGEIGLRGRYPAVYIRNRTKQAVLVTAGEVLAGGRQDRIIVRDEIIAPRASAYVEVNCAEQGRSTAGDLGNWFVLGGKAEAELRRVVQTSRSQPATWHAIAVLNDAKADTLSRDLPGESPARLEIAAALAPPTGTYVVSLVAAPVLERCSEYAEPLLSALSKHGKVVGLVAAVNNQIAAAEIYEHSRLFKRAQRSVMRSFVLDALSGDRALPGSAAPSSESAAKFLRDALEGAIVGERRLGTDMAFELEGHVSRSFVLRSDSGRIVHMDVYAK
ncbi:ARPP-1 family domain-containing protein [Planctomycetota bacterium]